MNKLLRFFELLIEFFSLLKIIASPLLVGIFFGFIVYYNKRDSVGLFISVLIVLCSFLLGILLAKWARKNGGATEFNARINASPDIDKAIRGEKDSPSSKA